MSQDDTPLTEEDMMEIMDIEDTKKDVVRKIYSDYQEVRKEMMKEGYHLKLAKYSTEQSFMNHIDNGVNFLLNLYLKLPEDHTMSDEEFVRELVSFYVCHDYHKLRNVGYNEEFDVEHEEVSELVETLSLEKIVENPNEEAIMGIIMSHHVCDERSSESEIPHDYLTHHYYILLADAISSSEKIEPLTPEDSNVRQRFSKANVTGLEYGMGYHMVDTESGELTNLIHRTVRDVLENRGYEMLKTYEKGNIYLKNRESELGESLLDEIYERFIENYEAHNNKYSLCSVESTNTDMKSDFYRYYRISFSDILVKGMDKVIKGVIKRSIEQSREKKRQATEKMREKVSVIEDATGREIETKNRRVEYLSASVHSIREYILGNNHDYENDAVGVMKMFGVHNQEREDEIETLREDHHEELSGSSWYYRYIVAQYIKDDYFEGEGGRLLLDKIYEGFMENMEDEIQEKEDALVGKIETEIKNYLAKKIEIDGKRLSEISDIPPTKSTFKCEYCGGETCSESIILNTPKDMDIEVNVTGSGDVECINPSEHPTLCYMCQLELFLRESLKENLENEESIFVDYMGEYGFVPQEEWIFKSIIDEQTYEGNLSINGGLSKKLVGEDIPEAVSNSMKTGKIDDYITQERGLNLSSNFGGGRFSVPLQQNNPLELYEGLTVIAIACAYSGARVHLTTEPMSRIDYTEDEILIIDEEISSEVPFFEQKNSLEDLENIISSVCTLEVLSQEAVKELEEKNHVRMVEKISKDFAAPASRLAHIYNNNVTDNERKPISHSSIMFADTEFTQKEERHEELIEIAPNFSSLIPHKGLDETEEIIRKAIRPYVEGDVEDNSWIIENLSEESSMSPEKASEVLAKEAVAKIEKYLDNNIDENETLNTLGEEIVHTVVAYKGDNHE